jgi:ribose transport system ATP-binding protein
LRLDDVCTGRVGPVSFEVRSGELVGLGGLRGAGQNQVGRAIAGIEPISSGSVWLAGRALDLRDREPAATAAGIRFVTSNREAEGLGPTMSVAENLFLNPGALGRRVWSAQRSGTERRRAEKIIRRFSIRPNDPARVITTLSGGNQQKVLLARWLGYGAPLLVLEEPTMGVDVGAKADIYEMLNHELSRGAAVLLVSSDLDEVAGICHRALIFDRGRIVEELGREELSVARLTAIVGGAGREPAGV